MKAIILAAGYGNRMRPLTDEKHKTLLKIGQHTIIERIIDSLIVNGVLDVAIVTGYRAEELEKFVKSHYSNLKLQFVNNPRYKETNNIYSLSLAFQSIEINEDIILIESDLIYEPAIVGRLVKSRYDNVALIDKFRSGMDGTVVTISNNVITNIIPPHLQDESFDFSDKYKSLNIYKFSQEFCRTSFKRLLEYYSKVFDDNCYYELVLGMLIYVQKETIYAEIINSEKWTEIDDPNDLAIAKFLFDEQYQFEVLENSFGGLWNHNILDFCYIRNMYYPNKSILAEMKTNLPRLVFNYGTNQESLNQKLAYFLLYKKDRLNITNGASQIYPILSQFLKGKKVLIPDPTFGEYSRIFGKSSTYADRVGVSISEIEEKSKECEVVVFVNPNNPSGTIIPTNRIIEFSTKNPNKFVIVDESFIEFSDEPSIIEHLENNPKNNIAVIKSLSKSLGIPGLRIGYIYSCNTEINNFVRALLPIWNINSFAEFFLEISLKHRGSLKQSAEKTKKDREDFFNALKQLDFLDTVFPSAANFILVRFNKNLPDIANISRKLLAKFSIYTKDISNKFSDGYVYLRLAVRLPEENNYLVTSLKKLFHP